MIRIENLDFKYARQHPLFRGLNFTATPGNICGLLGKNGAGKTTLLKLLSGLMCPQNGKLNVMGYQPFDRNPDFLNELILLPEEFVTPHLAAKTYIKLYSPFYPNFSEAVFNQHADNFDLDLDKKLNRYSYGQKKKFLISFGLATQCRLMLLDEPTNGLDIPSKSQFRKALAQSISEDRLFVISTHQAKDLGNLIDPIIILNEGKIIFNHSLMEISNHLTTDFQDQAPDTIDVLYFEKTLEGYLTVVENEGNEETRMDLELLFNTIMQNQKKISMIFNKGQN